MNVVVSYETERACGFRKPSNDGVGIYLRGESRGENCERLPFPLDVCPCCGGGFTYTRGFTWINPMSLFDPYMEPKCINTRFDPMWGTEYKQDDTHQHERCWVCNPELLGSRAGLIWIGEQHYDSPQKFMEEAARMGISRKIAAIPNGFVVGEHAIFLAHRKSIYQKNEEGKYEWKPAVFMAFKPSYIDLVIHDPDKVPDKAIEIAKRLGPDKVRIVKVVPDHTEEKEESEWMDLEE